MIYKNKSQLARVETENWALANLFCPKCGVAFMAEKANTKVFDFRCTCCDETYQLKSTSKKITRKLLGSEYYSFVNAIKNNNCPNFLILEYSIVADHFFVNRVIYIAKEFITEDVVEKRKPLSVDARRAGWTGYNLLIDHIPLEAMITIYEESQFVSIQNILFAIEKSKNISKKDWGNEIINIIRELAVNFSLSDIYKYEEKLKILFPKNKNIKPKIRQQLQILRDAGKIDFLDRGKYKKLDFL